MRVTAKEKTEVKAEAFVRDVLKNVFKQQIDPETIKSVAEKVASATYIEPKKKAA